MVIMIPKWWYEYQRVDFPPHLLQSCRSMLIEVISLLHVDDKGVVLKILLFISLFPLRPRLCLHM